MFSFFNEIHNKFEISHSVSEKQLNSKEICILIYLILQTLCQPNIMKKTKTMEEKNSSAKVITQK